MVLALFFTRGVSLKLWLDHGLFDREKLIYEEHLKRGNLKKVYWITYGSGDYNLSNELKKSKKLHQDIYIVEMPRFFSLFKMGSTIYSFISPLYHRKVLKDSHILKSNQMDGSWSAAIAKKIYNIPFINRTGYTLSLFFRHGGRPKIQQRIVEKIEREVFSIADISLVSSEQDKSYVLEKYCLNKKKITTLYNYIDLSLFYPLEHERNNKVIFIGRLSRQKNLFQLIESVANVGLELDIYGYGELEEKLNTFSKSLGAKVKFKGRVRNEDVSKILNQYKYYLLASYYEGMPKTLIEAMACGCICIGTNVPGINEIIDDGYNGILASDTSSESISKALEAALSITNEEHLIKFGVSTIKERFSLYSIAQKESTIFQMVSNAR